MRRSSVAGCPFYGFLGDRKHGQLTFPSVIVSVLCLVVEFPLVQVGPASVGWLFVVWVLDH